MFNTIPSKEKLNKHNMLIQFMRTYGWKIDPVVTITTGVRGTIHEHLKLPPNGVKKCMTRIHQIIINISCTYLVLNKRKINNKQAPMYPTYMVNLLVTLSFFVQKKPI